MDRKLSATAHVPRLSTVIDSPSGKVAHPSDTYHTHHRHDGAQQRPSPQHIHSGKLHKQPPPQQQQQAQSPRPRNAYPGPIDLDTQFQTLRPPLERGSTEVKIVDDSATTSPAGLMDEPKLPVAEDGITLADLPQIVEAAQAREQHRSLPRQSAIPFIAELKPLELVIVKHLAVLALQRSPLRDSFELDEILELVELKKASFWNKIFKAGNDKKNVKKKGESVVIGFCARLRTQLFNVTAGVFGIPLEQLVEREGSDSLHGASRFPLRVPSFIDDVVSAMRQMGTFLCIVGSDVHSPPQH